jgi:hypothetical protein
MMPIFKLPLLKRVPGVPWHLKTRDLIVGVEGVLELKLAGTRIAETAQAARTPLNQDPRGLVPFFAGKAYFISA